MESQQKLLLSLSNFLPTEKRLKNKTMSWSNAQNWCFAHFKLLKAEFFFSHNILTTKQIQNIESTGPAIGLLVMDVFQFCCCFFILSGVSLKAPGKLIGYEGCCYTVSDDQNRSTTWMSVTQNNVHCLLTWHPEAYSGLKKNLFQLSLWTSSSQILVTLHGQSKSWFTFC